MLYCTIVLAARLQNQKPHDRPTLSIAHLRLHNSKTPEDTISNHKKGCSICESDLLFTQRVPNVWNNVPASVDLVHSVVLNELSNLSTCPRFEDVVRRSLSCCNT